MKNMRLLICIDNTIAKVLGCVGITMVRSRSKRLKRLVRIFIYANISMFLHLTIYLLDI
jgi:hypothetical protein